MNCFPRTKCMAMLLVASIPCYSISARAQTASDTVTVLRTIASTWNSTHQTRRNAVLDEFSTPTGPVWVEKKAADKTAQRDKIACAVGTVADLVEPLKQGDDNRQRKEWYRALKKYGTLFTFIPIVIGSDSAVVEMSEGSIHKNDQEPGIDLLGTSSYRITLRRTGSSWSIVSKQQIGSSIGMIDL